MKRNRILALVGIVVLGSALACERKPDAPPMEEKAAVPAPPPPPPSVPAEPKASAATPEARLAVSTKVPAGIVVDQWTVGGKCNIEVINAEPKGMKPVPLKLGTSVKITGWAYDGAAAKLPDATHVRFASAAGVYYGTATLGVSREDVRQANHLDPALAATGFELTFDSTLLAAGDYSLALVLRAGDKTYICDNGRKIHLEP